MCNINKTVVYITAFDKRVVIRDVPAEQSKWTDKRDSNDNGLGRKYGVKKVTAAVGITIRSVYCI